VGGILPTLHELGEVPFDLEHMLVELSIQHSAACSFRFLPSLICCLRFEGNSLNNPSMLS
jgi:hypothetical protein